MNTYLYIRHIQVFGTSAGSQTVQSILSPKEFSDFLVNPLKFKYYS